MSLIMFLLFWGSSFPQTAPNAFVVASVKPSEHLVGRDVGVNRLTYSRDGLRGRNVNLKQLMVEAYGLRPYQVTGPDWLDTDEYDIEARSNGPTPTDELLTMLQTLLNERFRLSFHRETRQATVYALIVDKGGPKIHPLPDSSASRSVVIPNFRGGLNDLAEIIGVQLSIPTPAAGADPPVPYRASGPPPPVVDSTGLTGLYEINLDLKPEITRDIFTTWQRFLQEHCGLKLESGKSQIAVLVVDRAERTPIPN